MLNFISEVAGNFNVNPSCTRAAVISYADSARVSFSLTQHRNLASLQQAIRSLTVIGGSGSNLLSALQLVRSQVFTNSIVRTRARLIVGIITDSISCTPQLIAEAENLKRFGVIILGIGFTSGGRVVASCFSQIVSANQWIAVPNYSQYSNFVTTAVTAMCPPDYWGERALANIRIIIFCEFVKVLCVRVVWTIA